MRPVEHKKSGCDHITSIAETHLMPQIEKVIKSIATPESIMEAIKIELQKDLAVEQKSK